MGTILFTTAERIPKVVVCSGRKTRENLERECLVLNEDQKSWETNILDPLPTQRFYQAAVTLQYIGVYLIGGSQTQNIKNPVLGQTDRVSNFLAAGSTNWKKGPALPEKMDQPCLVAITEWSFLSIFDDNIREYQVDTSNATSDNGWQEASKWPKLIKKRVLWMSCSRINGKIVIAGGTVSGSATKSTEVLDLLTGRMEIAGDLTKARTKFHIVTISRSGVERAIALGGHDGSWYDDTVEQFDTKTMKWTRVGEKLVTKRGLFGAVALPQQRMCHAAGNHEVWG